MLLIKEMRIFSRCNVKSSMTAELSEFNARTRISQPQATPNKTTFWDNNTLAEMRVQLLINLPLSACKTAMHSKIKSTQDSSGESFSCTSKMADVSVRSCLFPSPPCTQRMDYMSQSRKRLFSEPLTRNTKGAIELPYHRCPWSCTSI